jgi:hypothetical protein
MLSYRRGNVNLRQRCCAKRVIAEDCFDGIDYDENEDAIRPPAHILSGLRAEITIETVDAARKRAAVMVRRQRLDPQKAYDAARRLCAASARASRGLGLGALIGASKKASRSQT